MAQLSLNKQEKKPISIAKFDNTNAVEVATLTITHACETAGTIRLTAGAEIDTIPLVGSYIYRKFDIKKFWIDILYNFNNFISLDSISNIYKFVGDAA